MVKRYIKITDYKVIMNIREEIDIYYILNLVKSTGNHKINKYKLLCSCECNKCGLKEYSNCWDNLSEDSVCGDLGSLLESTIHGIESYQRFRNSLFINSLLFKLIKNYEERRFNEIKVRK